MEEEEEEDGGDVCFVIIMVATWRQQVCQIVKQELQNINDVIFVIFTFVHVDLDTVVLPFSVCFGGNQRAAAKTHLKVTCCSWTRL